MFTIIVDDKNQFTSHLLKTTDHWNADDWAEEVNARFPNWQNYVVKINGSDICGRVKRLT